MKYKGIELYQNGKKYGVLVSPGFGAGWSTWNSPQLAYDKRVIEFWQKHVGQSMSNNKAAEDYFASLGYGDVYFGGFEQLRLEWVEKGEAWCITEYDGYESLKRYDEDDYTVFC